MNPAARCPTNLPEYALNLNREEIQRITIIRNNAAHAGADPYYLAVLDTLIAMNTRMIQVGRQPFSPAGLLEMMNLCTNIRAGWGTLNVYLD
ncbi:hypothetical protein GCK72_025012 [Caenorhabditis remanei]|uniref:Uncharacterized protein n=1 Tax=Caenorhabditis remanei TaxID=31234 RepID=A0A2P4WLS0_CAERE|nr:hypothetical protein GCK72_025012 [Caenorhabditis remanei]KAF1748545.1 hypothetical protein GCK72_025012 [Caenorhabditis remanei]